MNIAGIINDAVNGYDGVAIEIYVSGCTHGCKGCHNPEMQSFNYGEPLDMLKLIQYSTDQEQWYDIISILGGDLLCSHEDEAKKLGWTLKLGFPQKKLWLFTGAEHKDIPQWCYEVFDVIKYGRYIEELRDESYELATTNQCYIRKGCDY